MQIKYLLCLFLILFPVIATAEWKVVTHTLIDDNSQAKVAQNKNEQGYSLEIYRDNNNVVRLRFSIPPMLDNLKNKTCPTYQIDDRDLVNRSLNDARCISDNLWAEYILGQIEGNELESTSLHNIMNGNNVVYRFIRKNGGYDEVSFSLDGSKIIINSIIDENVTVVTEQGYRN